jgi:hypothetical protein
VVVVGVVVVVVVVICAQSHRSLLRRNAEPPQAGIARIESTQPAPQSGEKHVSGDAAGRSHLPPAAPGTHESYQPVQIAAGPDGAMWFTEAIGNKIGLVGTGPPAAKITRAKIGSQHGAAIFSFKAIGSATGFQCALVTRREHHKQPKPHFSSCKSPKTYKHLKSGKYTFEVRALSAPVSAWTTTCSMPRIRRGAVVPSPGNGLGRDLPCFRTCIFAPARTVSECADLEHVGAFVVVVKPPPGGHAS